MYQRIRDLREDRDLMQEDIANLLNCTQACYSNYENGKRDIPTEVLNKLADFYGVSTDYLLGKESATSTYLDVSGLPQHQVQALTELVAAMRE